MIKRPSPCFSSFRESIPPQCRSSAVIRCAWVEAYRGRGFDLILAGHAHGGQWRLPGVVNGLLAPDQGLFPPYAGWRYELEGGTLIVSRGLARESTRVPRVFNRPELVIIDVTPAC